MPDVVLEKCYLSLFNRICRDGGGGGGGGRERERYPLYENTQNGSVYPRRGRTTLSRTVTDR